MQRTPGNTTAEKEKYWTQIIEEARKFPAGVAAYCADNGISHNNYYYWFKRLRVKHLEWTDLSNTPKVPRAKVSAKKKRLPQPEIEVSERPRRRKFNAKEKSRILKEIDSSSKGKIASILRREGIYSSHLQKWRTELQQAALEPKKRGPKANPLMAENRDLQKQLAKIEKQLDQANRIIELQKKISELLGVTIDENDQDSSD
jgi:transposase